LVWIFFVGIHYIAFTLKKDKGYFFVAAPPTPLALPAESRVKGRPAKRGVIEDP
jgi:hypothetical protein